MPKTAKFEIEYLGPNDPADIAGGTKKVATGAEAAVEQATSLLPYATAGGRVSIKPTAEKPTSQHVHFPQGRFTVPPLVFINSRGGQPGSHVIEETADNVTATGFDAVLYRNNSTSTGLDWFAVQMQPASAEG